MIPVGLNTATNSTAEIDAATAACLAAAEADNAAHEAAASSTTAATSSESSDSPSEHLQPPFGTADSQTEPIITIAVIIQTLLGLVGAGALLMFIWGGFLMIFSGGSEERVTKGKTILIWTVIGLLIILVSYAVLSFVFNLFKTAVTT